MREFLIVMGIVWGLSRVEGCIQLRVTTSLIYLQVTSFYTYLTNDS